MVNTRQLTDPERIVARRLLESVRTRMVAAARSDASLLWAIRRYVYMRLQHDERGTPMQRRALKLEKMDAQKGRCAICSKKLPDKGAELDRFSPMKGYTAENTRLICHQCHRDDQAQKGFA